MTPTAENPKQFKTWLVILRVLIITVLLFAACNVIFAVLNPLEALGRVSLYNTVLPGRERLPYGEDSAKSYNLSTYNLPAMFASHVIAQPKVQWRMSTAFTAVFDIHQGAAQRLAKVVEETSGGRFRIEVFPGGQIMQPFECFDATSKGTIEAFMAASYYWSATEPAADWFTSVPFGMDPQGTAIWYHQGGGLALWEEAYAPFNLVPRLGPGFAPQGKVVIFQAAVILPRAKNAVRTAAVGQVEVERIT